ncbi:hypothetical protein OESDEN_01161 [Oesophagostomum dentatum]|uniref:Uncharacterized protein n=1 Tax=Oesophagostomum dentatum TaxID=61180 RepID=A0A0B1TTT4_OESDE|nr:hypothetical protein OESDEN_01161 [Oesophagostomum dentatum]
MQVKLESTCSRDNVENNDRLRKKHWLKTVCYSAYLQLCYWLCGCIAASLSDGYMFNPGSSHN